MAKTRVYYNGACPICDAGITQQRKWLVPFEVDIEWIDVHRDNIAVAQLCAGLEFVRARWHGRRSVRIWVLKPNQRPLGG